MKYRKLGKTELSVSEVCFGCGSTGGLMVRASHEEQIKADQEALNLGINYFDTAANYGGGQSEKNLGNVLDELKPNVFVGTKVNVPLEAVETGDAIQRSVEESLRRLKRDSVDLLQLHNPITVVRQKTERGDTLAAMDVLKNGGVADVFDNLRAHGLIRHMGFTGLGYASELRKLVESGRFETIQAYYSVINPSGSFPVPKSFTGQDFELLLNRASEKGMGVIAIRVLGAGAVGGAEARKSPAAPDINVALAKGADYDMELRRARALEPLLGASGKAMAKASIRFALSNPWVSTAAVGFSTIEHIHDAAEAVNEGALAEATMARLRELWLRDFRA